MLNFDDDEANLIISGLNTLVKQVGLENPALFQASYGIVVKLQEDAKRRTESALAVEQTKASLQPYPQTDAE